MKIFLSVLILLAGCISTATAGDNVKVIYKAQKPSYTNPGLVNKSDMILIASPDKSLYFNETSLYCDSMTSTPEGKKALREMQMAAWMTVTPTGITINKNNGNVPDKKIYQYIEKDNGSATIHEYNEWAKEAGYYTEPFDELQWEIEDSTTTILGFECIKAKADYHGRQWTAWFTPEIPVSDGPWKLRGLPGLILRAYSNDLFLFKATEVNSTDSEVPTIYSTDSYAKIDRKKAFANQEHYNNNREAYLKAQYGDVKIISQGKKEHKFEKLKHAIETDY